MGAASSRYSCNLRTGMDTYQRNRSAKDPFPGAGVMRRMYHLLALSGVTAEVVAVLLVWLSADDALAAWQEGALLFTAVVFHSASSYYLARMFWQSLPRRYKLPPRRSLGLLFAF